MPSKHSKQRMHGRISSALLARAFLGKSGSAMKARAANTTSALPEAMISSMNSGSLSAPTTPTGILTCFLNSAAYCTLGPSGRKMLGCVTVKTSGRSWMPAEAWIMSTLPSNCMAISTLSSMPNPPS